MTKQDREEKKRIKQQKREQAHQARMEEIRRRNEAREERRENWRKSWQALKWKWKGKKWAKLQRGDNQAKVVSIIGKPDSIEKGGKDSGQETWEYDCGSEGKKTITFQDGSIEKIEVKYQ